MLLHQGQHTQKKGAKVSFVLYWKCVITNISVFFCNGLRTVTVPSKARKAYKM